MSLQLTGWLDHEADRIHKHISTVGLCWDLNSAVGVSPRCDLCRLTSSHVSVASLRMTWCPLYWFSVPEILSNFALLFLKFLLFAGLEWPENSQNDRTAGRTGKLERLDWYRHQYMDCGMLPDCCWTATKLPIWSPHSGDPKALQGKGQKLADFTQL